MVGMFSLILIAVPKFVCGKGVGNSHWQLSAENITVSSKEVVARGFFVVAWCQVSIPLLKSKCLCKVRKYSLNFLRFRVYSGVMQSQPGFQLAIFSKHCFKMQKWKGPSCQKRIWSSFNDFQNEAIAKQQV